MFSYHPNSDKSRCLKDIKLNEKCFIDDECVVENARCLNSVCKCKASHVPSQDNDVECLPLVTALYEPCRQDTQCSTIPNAFCDGVNSTCICNKDHHDINAVRIIKNSSEDDQLVTFEISFNFFQRCWSSVRLNGLCESDENCVIAHSSCVNKRCECDEGFHETRDKFCSNATTVQISFFLLLVALVFTSVRLF